MADQELFDGEIKTVIEDDENLSFRKPNPATAGSRVISWANFKIVLNSLYVSLTGNQIINGIKQFVSSPTVPDPTTSLQAVNLRTLLLKTTDPEFIDFVPQDPIPEFKIGRIFYDDIENTWTAFNDIDGISLQLGEELRARLINDTGSTLLDGKAVSVIGAVGASLQVELMDASDLDSSIRGFGLMTHDVIDGQPGYAVRYGAVRNLNTLALTVGNIVYGDPENPGELTTIRPTAPNYPIRIGICLISDAVNGLIGVDNLAFNGSDTSLNIEGFINGVVTQTPDIDFDASSGDIVATVTNEAFPSKMLPLLFSGKRYLLDTITSPQAIIIPPGLSSTETEESTLYVKLNAGVPELAVTTAPTISEPHAIISVQTVFNVARTNSDGKPLSYRRYNNAMDSLAEGVAGSFGLTNVITNWIRLRGGAGWTSGQDATPTVNDTTIKLAMTAGLGGQLHKANLPLFDGNNYLIYNDNANAITYEPSANLTDITETSAGVTLLNNNVYYPIKLYYLLNSNGVGNDVIATRPSGFYTTADEAKSDALKYGTSLADPKTELNSYAVYTIVIGRTGGGGATITLIELQNNRKRTLKGDEGGGGAGGAGGTDDKVRVSAADTINNYLNDKIADSDSIAKEIINPGSNEQLKVNVKAELNTWYVSKGGLDTNNGSPQQKLLTIQKAVTDAVSGDSIYIAKGPYLETVTIPAGKNLNIYGESSGILVNDNSVLLSNGSFIISGGSNVYIENISTDDSSNCAAGGNLFLKNYGGSFGTSTITGNLILQNCSGAYPFTCDSVAGYNSRIVGNAIVSSLSQAYYGCSSSAPHTTINGSVSLYNSYFTGNITTVGANGDFNQFNSVASGSLSIAQIYTINNQASASKKDNWTWADGVDYNGTHLDFVSNKATADGEIGSVGSSLVWVGSAPQFDNYTIETTNFVNDTFRIPGTSISRTPTTPVNASYNRAGTSQAASDIDYDSSSETGGNLLNTPTELQTATKEVRNWVNAPLKALGIYTGSLIEISSTGAYSNYTLTANHIVTFAESGHKEGIGRIVKFISDGTKTLTFVKPAAYELDIPNNLTNGGTLASGRYTFAFIFKNGEIEVSTQTKQAIASVVPTVSSMSVEAASPNDLIVNLSESCTFTNLGGTFRVNSTPRTLSAVSGSPGTVQTFTISGAAILSTDTLDFAYDSGTGDTIAVAAPNNELETFTATTVTNNVTASLARNTLETDNYFNAPNVSHLSINGDFAFSTWLYFNEIKTAQKIGKRQSSTLEWSLDLGGGSNAFRIFVVDTGGLLTISTSSIPAIGGWYHVYCEYDSTTKKSAISIDDETLIISGTGLTATPKTGLVTFQIGTDDLLTVTDMYMDDVAFWNRLLTTTERTWLFAKNKYSSIGSGGGSALATNLISWYECNEASGNLIDANGGTNLTETGTCPSVAGI